MLRAEHQQVVPLLKTFFVLTTGTVQKSLRQSLAIAKVLLFYTANSVKGADVGHKMGFETSSTVNGSPYTLTRVWTFLFLFF